MSNATMNSMTDLELRGVMRRNVNEGPIGHALRVRALRTLEARQHRRDGRIGEAIQAEAAAREARS